MSFALLPIITAVKRDAAGGHYRDRLGRFRTQVRLPRSSRIEGLAEVADQIGQLIGRLEETFSSEINVIQDNAVIANLGISMAETGKYRKIRSALIVSIAESGHWHVYTVSNKNDEEYRQDASFSLSYLVGLVLLAQETYPEAIDRIGIDVPLTEQSMWRQRREKASTKGNQDRAQA